MPILINTWKFINVTGLRFNHEFDERLSLITRIPDHKSSLIIYYNNAKIAEILQRLYD
jgi:hypothetical protein